MAITCIVVGCGSRGDREKGLVSFFRIPKIIRNKGSAMYDLSKKRREKWLSAIKRADLTEKKIIYQRVCSKHFLTGKLADLEDIDHPDWIPSKDMGYTSTLTASATSVKRKMRIDKRQKIKELQVEQVLSTNLADSVPMDVVANETGTSSQTDLIMIDLANLYSDLSITHERCNEANIKLEKLTLTFESFINDSRKCIYYTGICTEVLQVISEHVLQYIPVHFNSSLQAPEQLILTLMKLRLNLDFKDLAFRFGISSQTASTYFIRVINILYQRLKSQIYWPDRESLQKNVPFCFKEVFKNKITVIIDCFEIFIEKPANYLTRAQCWSNYKHHCTIKVLIGITPQGSISYVSNAWGGRISDKKIVELSDFLDHIVPGDIIIADRGFLISDMVRILQAKLVIPAFTKGKSQLHPIEIEETRQIAHVRIHVERVIGMIKSKFSILREKIPITMLCSISEGISILDKIIVVCCALINWSPPIL